MALRLLLSTAHCQTRACSAVGECQQQQDEQEGEQPAWQAVARHV
jgi:hypothetical protein